MNPDILRAFLDDVKEDPFDDTPRLILADWLEDHSGSEAVQDRGTLLRLQCEAAALSEFDPEAIARRRQARELIDRHGHLWLGDFAPLPFLEGDFVGGMLHLTMDRMPLDRDWIDTISPASWQWVESLTSLVGFGPIWHRSILHHLARLEVHQQIGDGDGWVDLVSSVELTRLTDVTILHAEGDDGTFRWLRKNTPHTRWRALTLRCGGVNPRGWETLMGSAFVPTLETLALTHCGLTGQGFQVLAGTPNLARLRRLEVPYNRIPGEALRALVDAPYVPHLERLSLAGNPLADLGLLAECPLDHLRHLDLGDTSLTGAGLEPLFDADWLGHLKNLDLRDNPLGDGVTAFFAGDLGSLEVLRLPGCGLTPEAIAALAVASPSALRELNLRDNLIGDAGLAQLLAGRFPALRVLNLDAARLTDEGLRHLADWPGLAELWHLSLADNNFSPAGVRLLMDSVVRSPRTRIVLR